VIFDVYGTMLISAAGDVGPDSAGDDEEAFRQALRDGGWEAERENLPGVALLRGEIVAEQGRKREQGISWPEVDILEIWSRVLKRLGFSGRGKQWEEALERTALSYECLTNPVWPMPGLLETLTALRESGLRLGILSNAQFYTPLLFETLCGHSLGELGFVDEWLLFSYQFGEGKPSPLLFETLNERLATAGILPHEVLYVGNDMLKDIYPAARVGWQTALFAGDRRSLRLREDCPEVRGLKADLVLTEFCQLAEVLKGAPLE